MKINNIYKTRHESKKQLKSIQNFENHLNVDQVAAELVDLARIHLPDRVLRGSLTGMEADIRQDAVLLALNWYLRQFEQLSDRSDHDWLAPRAISGALRIQKKEYVKIKQRESKATELVSNSDDRQCLHPSMIRSCEWSTSAMKKMIKDAIKVALKSGKISHLNACIAIRVFVDLVPASQLASHLNINRSAVYQHINRTRRAIPAILDGIEFPYINQL